MNQLAQLLRSNPSVVDELAGEGAELVSIQRLTDTLQQLPGIAPLDFDVVERASADPVVGPYVAESYLRALPTELWEGRRAQALPSYGFASPSEWVTFVRGAESGRGLSMPQDSSASQRVSLFTRVEGAVRRISIERPGESGASVSIALERRCEDPDGGQCAPGACGCVLQEVADPDGLECRCGDGTPP
jgi:hypothetical protein